ncbi:MAG TPA: STAS domain-containing protein [Solirubrobacterales bacterium]|nr:STAS domain-containing protein [Solirubrobacterales bacterium]
MPLTDSEVKNGLLTLRSAIQAGQIRLTLEGELDLSNAETVEAALDVACAEGAGVLVDLGPLEFIDSTGISLLVRALGRDEAARISFLPSESVDVRRLLNLTGLDQRMPLSAPADGQPVLPSA